MATWREQKGAFKFFPVARCRILELFFVPRLQIAWITIFFIPHLSQFQEYQDATKMRS
jgi:hypothetical protein